MGFNQAQAAGYIWQIRCKCNQICCHLGNDSLPTSYRQFACTTNPNSQRDLKLSNSTHCRWYFEPVQAKFEYLRRWMNINILAHCVSHWQPSWANLFALQNIIRWVIFFMSILCGLLPSLRVCAAFAEFWWLALKSFRTCPPSKFGKRGTEVVTLRAELSTWMDFWQVPSINHQRCSQNNQSAGENIARTSRCCDVSLQKNG